jgi:hypothetical protein
MVWSTSERSGAGSNGNIEPQSKRGRGTKDLRGAGYGCGVRIISAEARGVVAVGVQIRRGAGDGNNRAALGRTRCVPAVACAACGPIDAMWRGG